ncbi:MAG: imidazolonepropionase-like amidohydrolase [Halioglobus sp.]|jgi:imidazolonepropionase-like amidohydrolase
MSDMVNSSTPPACLIRNASILGSKGESSLLLSGGLIEAVGSEADSLSAKLDGVQVIDASGLTVMPGLIDAHCHVTFDQPGSNDELFFHRREGLAAIVASVNAQKVLRAGVTSIFDADCIFDVGIDLRDAIEAGVVPGPRMNTGGNVLITSVGGTAGRLLPDSGRRGYAVIVSTKDEIVREIRRQVKAGVDWIKVHVSGLPMRGKAKGEIQAWTLDELKLVCDTAHSMGIPVVGHCRNASSTRDAAIAGFDMILHATNMDDEAVAALVDAKIPVVPTFTFQANLVDYGDKVGADPGLQKIFREEIANSSVTLRQAYDNGVPLLSGSESGFSVTPYGEWHHKEMQIFVDHLGFTPEQAIHSATEAAAVALRMEGEIGCIKPGYCADLLLIDGDPLKDLSLLGNKSKIKSIFKAGKAVDLETPLPDHWHIPGWRVNKFSEEVLTQKIAFNK